MKICIGTVEIKFSNSWIFLSRFPISKHQPCKPNYKFIPKENGHVLPRWALQTGACIAHKIRVSVRRNCQLTASERNLSRSRKLFSAAFFERRTQRLRWTIGQRCPGARTTGCDPNRIRTSALRRCAWSLIQKWKWMRVQMLARSGFQRSTRLSLLLPFFSPFFFFCSSVADDTS